MTMDREPTMLFRSGTLIREPQKVKSLWSTLSPPLSPLNREPSKFDQSSLVLVQFQLKLRETPVEFFQAGDRFAVVLTANHKVVCIAHQHYVAATLFPPPLDPQVENIVQVKCAASTLESSAGT